MQRLGADLMTPVTTGGAAAPAGPSAHRRSRPLEIASLVALLAGSLWWMYLLATHAYAGDSDKASTVLEGQAVGQGHVLLHGWVVPMDSFWTLDQLFYAATTRLFGLRLSLVHWGPALFGALFLVAGIAAAAEGRRGRSAVTGAAVVAALLLLPSPALAQFYLGLGYHVSTTLCALLAFLLLRKGRFDRWWCAGTVLIAFGLLGDLLLVPYGVVPVLGGGLAAMLRRRDWRSGIAPVTAALGGCALAAAARSAVVAVGGFAYSPALPTAKAHQVGVNIGDVFRYGGELAGFTQTAVDGTPSVLADVHIAGGVLLLACFGAASWRLFSGAVRGAGAGPAAPRCAGPELLDDTLVVAALGAVATFVLLSLHGAFADTRYLAPSVLFMAVLAGRVVAQAWPQAVSRRAGGALTAAGVFAVLALTAGLGWQLSSPPPAPAVAPLASWLQDHDLHNGLGDYGAASIVTVASSGAVTIRPVSGGKDGRLAAMGYQVSASWYAGQQFQFLVYQPSSPAGGVDLASATKTWGHPRRVYSVGIFRVVVWPRPITLRPV
jgi:hypothetical protein